MPVGSDLIGNATSAILNMTPGEIYANKHLFEIERQQLQEAFRVMKAYKFTVTDLPKTPVKLFNFAMTWMPSFLAQPILERAIGSGRGTKMPSFHIDLHAGHGKSEVDYLNGAVVRFGEKAHIKTPINRILRDTLLKMTNQELPIDTFDHQPQKFYRYLTNNL